MSVHEKKCPRCGGSLEDDKPCPNCLLMMVSQSTDQLDADLDDLSSPMNTSGTPPQLLPDLDAVRKAFSQAQPQLEVIEMIGRGGMGTVFKARQPKLDRFVALKILSADLATQPAFAERFAQEGKLLARLSHPNIVSVYDYGETDGFYYLILEHVDGVNLRQAMREKRFTPEQALAVVPKICEALQYAHEEGVLHRDIKPENILLDTRSRIKITDFGIASVARWTTDGATAPRNNSLPLVADAENNNDFDDKRLTQTGQILGTPNYMAPEQRNDPQNVDHRADIYSLGVVFYELLTGELPKGRFPLPSETTPVDANVDHIVLKAMEREREKRHQSAGEMKTEIETATSVVSSLNNATKITEIPHALPKRTGSPYGIWLAFAVVLCCVSIAASIILPIQWVKARKVQTQVQNKQELLDARRVYWQTVMDRNKEWLDPEKHAENLPPKIRDDYTQAFQEHLSEIQKEYDQASEERRKNLNLLNQFRENDRTVYRNGDPVKTFEVHGTQYEVSPSSGYFPFKRNLYYTLWGFLFSCGFSNWFLWRSRHAEKKRDVALAGTVAIVSSSLLILLPVLFCWFTQSAILEPKFASYIFDGDIWGGVFLMPGIVFYILSMYLLYLVYSDADKNESDTMTMRGRACLALALVVCPGALISVGNKLIWKSPGPPDHYSYLFKNEVPKHQEVSEEFEKKLEQIAKENGASFYVGEDWSLFHNERFEPQYTLTILRSQIKLVCGGEGGDIGYIYYNWRPQWDYMTTYRTMGPFYTFGIMLLVLLPGFILSVIHLLWWKSRDDNVGVIPASAAILIWPFVIGVIGLFGVCYLLLIGVEYEGKIQTYDYPDFAPSLTFMIVGFLVVGIELFIIRRFSRRHATTTNNETVIPLPAREPEKRHHTTNEAKTTIESVTVISSVDDTTEEFSAPSSMFLYVPMFVLGVFAVFSIMILAMSDFLSDEDERLTGLSDALMFIRPFFDPVGFLGVLGLLASFITSCGGWHDLRSGFFSRASRRCVTENKRIGFWFWALAKGTLGIGGVVTLLKAVIMLGDMDPEMILEGFCHALLPLGYSTILAFLVFAPFSMSILTLRGVADDELIQNPKPVSVTQFSLGVFLSICIIVPIFALCHGAPFSVFFDLPSILILCLVLFFGARRSWSTLGDGLFLIPDREGGAARSIKYFEMLYQTSLLGGGIGMLVGITIMLTDMDPETIGSGMAIALLTTLYALTLSTLFFQPLSLAMRDRTNTDTEIQPPQQSRFAVWGCELMILWLIVACVTVFFYRTINPFPTVFVQILDVTIMLTFIVLPCVITVLGWQHLWRIRTTGNKSGWLAGILTALFFPLSFVLTVLVVGVAEVLKDTYFGPDLTNLTVKMLIVLGTILFALILVSISVQYAYRTAFPKPLQHHPNASLVHRGLGLFIASLLVALIFVGIAWFWYPYIFSLYQSQVREMQTLNVKQKSLLENGLMNYRAVFQESTPGEAKQRVEQAVQNIESDLAGFDTLVQSRMKAQMNDWSKAETITIVTLLTLASCALVLSISGSGLCWRHLAKIRRFSEKSGRVIGLIVALTPIVVALTVVPSAVLRYVISLGYFGPNQNFATAMATLVGGFLGFLIAAFVVYLTCRWQGYGVIKSKST